MRTCEARVRAHGIDRPCGQKVGVRGWTDEAGIEHAACAVHIAERLHRNPPAIPEPEWLDNCAACGGPIKDDGCPNCDFDWVTWRRQQEDPNWLHEDAMTLAKAEDDRAWTPGELQEAWGK